MQPLRRFLADLIRWALQTPPQPGFLKLRVVGEQLVTLGPVCRLNADGTVTQVGELRIMTKNITDIDLPTLNGNPGGVVTRRFKIDTTANPAVSVFPQQDFTVDPANPDALITVSGVRLEQGVEVKLSLVDIDAAGNMSVPRELVTTPSDVTPPSEPGEFQMRVTGEEV